MEFSMSAIGQSYPRVDAYAKVTGEARYPGDFDLPNQTHMKILFANRPHARIRSIDVSRAEALPGVIAVFTAKDVPVNEYGLIAPINRSCAVLDRPNHMPIMYAGLGIRWRW
jgi:CO/xanthine dehydrogenase Mo-binding subunit